MTTNVCKFILWAIQRCAHNNSVKRPIVEQLQTFFHQHNELVALFTTALDRKPSDNHKIVIKADKTPTGQHATRLNAPVTHEVFLGDNLKNRDIALHRRSVCPKHIDHMMRCNNSTDIDEISIKILNNLPDSGLIIPVMAINKSFALGKFPPYLKPAFVIPLFKGGNSEDPSNFRPISLLSTLSKIIEKLLSFSLFT